MEVKRQLCTSEKHHLGVFISNADCAKYPNMTELMRRVVAVSKAEELNVQYTGSGTEKAALFCSILTDLAKVQDYNKAKSLMKEFVNDYVDEFFLVPDPNVAGRKDYPNRLYKFSFRKAV